EQTAKAPHRDLGWRPAGKFFQSFPPWVQGLHEDQPTQDEAMTAFPDAGHAAKQDRDVLPGMNAGASTSAGPSPIEGSGTAWVLLGSWALSPARPTPIHPRRERRGFSALLVTFLAQIRHPQFPHSSWVATGRGLHKPVSSSPPFKTGLAVE